MPSKRGEIDYVRILLIAILFHPGSFLITAELSLNLDNAQFKKRADKAVKSYSVCVNIEQSTFPSF